MKKELKGKLVVVTGAARGIGRATVEGFIELGARVVACDVQPFEPPQGALRRTLDVRDAQAFRALIEALEETEGPVEVLVNNAGVMHLGRLVEQPPEHDRQQLEVNLFGVLNGVRAVLPRMVARGRGHIVNVASVAGRVAPPGAAVYAASKHAVVGLTEALWQEEADKGVDFSYVCPGPVNTELYAGAKRLSWPRLLEPKEVAQALIEAVQSRQVEVYVPKVSALSSVLPGLLPRRAADWVGRLMGVREMFLKVDHQARSAYVERISEK